MDYVIIPRQIAYPLRAKRKELGLTQDELARAASVSRQLVNKTEAGLAPGIGLDRLLRMLEPLGLALAVVSLDDAEDERPPITAITRQGDEYRAAFAVASALPPRTARLLGIDPTNGSRKEPSESEPANADGGR